LKIENRRLKIEDWGRGVEHPKACSNPHLARVILVLQATTGHRDWYMSAQATRRSVTSPEELEERLLEFGAPICRLANGLRPTLVNRHVAGQLIRSATAPVANYAEARAAPLRKAFVYRLRVCLQGLRETRVWLALLARGDSGLPTGTLERECRELLAIFTSSINTARRIEH